MMTLSQVAEAVPGSLLHGRGDIAVSELRWDSRKVSPGDLFFALKGSQDDGARFVQQAAAQGASAIVAEHGVAQALADGGVPVVGVSDAREAMALVAREYYGKPDLQLRVIGVTGTNGKTTTSFNCAHLFRRSGTSCGVIGTIRYEVGEDHLPAPHTTPEAPEVYSLLRRMVAAGCRAVAMEVSSHALVQHRVGGLEFDAAIFTNLTQDHLDYHGDMESYFQAKRSLFTGLGSGSKSGAAIINGDDAIGRRLVNDPEVNAQKFSFAQAGGDLAWRLVEWGAEGASVELTYGGQTVPVRVPVHGLYNIQNIAGAVLALLTSGADFRQVAELAQEIPPVPGRMQPVPNQRGITVLVDYAHTDDALRKALAAAKAMPHRELVCLFGCGGDRDRAKRPLMARAAWELCDRVVLTSDNPRSENPQKILEEVMTGFPDMTKVEVEPDRARAIRFALESASEGDIVLLAGKGHETYQEIAGVRHQFDDVEHAARVLTQKEAA